VQYSITFDALLVGHDAGVTSLTWRPSRSDTEPVPVLLSTSVDSSVILWSQSTVQTGSNGETTSLWVNQQRFGDVGGQRLGGFVGGVWCNNGSDALAWGWGGGWRRWTCTTDDPFIGNQLWEERGAVSGHRGAVSGLNWSNNGEYIVSAG